jgi:uncharacterized protein (DUF1015 family)
MASLTPFRGIRFNTDIVNVGSALAPPYDVISDADRERLYARDLRNIVRIDAGRALPGDVPGSNDVYLRAAGHLRSWLDNAVLLSDQRPALYVHEHRATPADGGPEVVRRGVLGLVPALPWEESEVRPHERTLRGPREDRLCLLQATATHTSAVMLMADGVGSAWERVLAPAATPVLDTPYHDPGGPPQHHRLWRIEDAEGTEAIAAELAGARLYVADGHHRFETAAHYAQSSGGGSVLVHVVDAHDPATAVLPTHRLLREGDPAVFTGRPPGGWELQPADGPEQAMAAAAEVADTHHAFTLLSAEGAQLLRRPRTGRGHAGLDTVALGAILDSWGITEERVAAGALAYTRDAAEARRQVGSGETRLAILCNPTPPAVVLEVADAGLTMPQKSTYFWPKIPTGLVLAPAR